MQAHRTVRRSFPQTSCGLAMASRLAVVLHPWEALVAIGGRGLARDGVCRA